MKKTIVSFVRETFNDQRGQVLPWVALMFVSPIILGMAGMSVDVGRGYIVRSQLQNIANAAAMASANALYSGTSSSAQTVAAQYGAGSGNLNANDGVASASTTFQSICLNMLMPGGSGCTSSSTANAVRVKETAAVPTYFMKLFGIPTLNISTTATATPYGKAQPWNLAIILDATGSMNKADTNCGSGMTEFSCATTAIQGMLEVANPCAAGFSSCTSSNANLHVALFSFPGITTTTVSDDTSSCTTPSYMLYTLPLTTSTSYAPGTYAQSGGANAFSGTYEIVPFSSDYYSTTASNHLNTSSQLVKAVTGCMSPIQAANSQTGGMKGSPNSGGATYFAAPIYAAQDALLAEQNANPGTKNAIIFLSDGQANLLSAGNNFPSQQNFSLSSGSGYSSPTGNGTYPDVTDECQQAMMAAQQAANAGTRVYAVAYGAEQYGCSSSIPNNASTYGTGSAGTDSSLLTFPNSLNVPFSSTSMTALNPCITMENIANPESGNTTNTWKDFFFSDYQQSDSGTHPDTNCIDSTHSSVTLTDILKLITAQLLQARIVPNNASYTVVP